MYHYHRIVLRYFRNKVETGNRFINSSSSGAQRRSAMNQSSPSKYVKSCCDADAKVWVWPKSYSDDYKNFATAAKFKKDISTIEKEQNKA